MVGLWLGPQFTLNLSGHPLVKGNGSSRQFVDDLRLEEFYWGVTLLRMLLARELQTFPQFLFNQQCSPERLRPTTMRLQELGFDLVNYFPADELVVSQLAGRDGDDRCCL